MPDMTDDLFADQAYGKAALAKMQPTSPNFRLYCAGWLENGGHPDTWEVMVVTGAEFREATRGPNKGKLSILIPGTKKTVHVHISEIRAHASES